MDQIMLVQPEEAFTILFNAILAIGAGYLSAPITTVLTNGAKFIPWIGKAKAPTLRAVIAVLLTITMWIAAALGFEVQLDNVLELVTIAGPMLFQLLFNIRGSGQVHQVAYESGDNRVFGYSRTREFTSNM